MRSALVGGPAMKTIAVNIEKGGAGKTTIACHLAWHLADAGHPVLVLELDRQCNASTALRDCASLRSCKQLFENGFQASVGEGRAIYSNRMTGDNHDYLMALHTDTPPAARAFNS